MYAQKTAVDSFVSRSLIRRFAEFGPVANPEYVSVPNLSNSIDVRFLSNEGASLSFADQFWQVILSHAPKRTSKRLIWVQSSLIDAFAGILHGSGRWFFPWKIHDDVVFRNHRHFVVGHDLKNYRGSDICCGCFPNIGNTYRHLQRLPGLEFKRTRSIVLSGGRRTSELELKPWPLIEFQRTFLLRQLIVSGIDLRLKSCQLVRRGLTGFLPVPPILSGGDVYKVGLLTHFSELLNHSPRSNAGREYRQECDRNSESGSSYCFLFKFSELIIPNYRYSQRFLNLNLMGIAAILIWICRDLILDGLWSDLLGRKLSGRERGLLASLCFLIAVRLGFQVAINVAQ